MPLLPYNTIAARNERTYITPETTFGTYVPATNSTACRSTRLTLTPSIPMLIRRDKTGSLSQTVGIKGRIYGTWQMVMDFTGNGVLGVAPDCNILLASAFGQLPATAPTVTVSSAANVASVLVFTAVSTAGMNSGQAWIISGITGTGFTAGDTYIVSVLSATTFSATYHVAAPYTAAAVYTAVTASGSYAGSGTATNAGVVYTLSDASYSFDIWSYRNINGTAPSPPSSGDLEQRVAGSCVTTSLEINFGGDFSTLTASGDCLCILDSDYFSSASTPEKGGLGAYPSEPSAPVTNGYPAPGFVGVAAIDSGILFEIKTGTFTVNTGRRLIRDSFGSYVPTGIEAAERMVMMNFLTDDTDSAALADLKVKAKLKTAIPFSITIGNVSGNEFVFSGANLVLEPANMTETAIRYQDQFPQSRMYSSTYTAKDEISLVAQ